MSSERFTGSTWDDVRLDHRRRYEWADAHFPANGLGLDAFCGAGYGTQMLTRNVGRTCLGIDGDADSISYAQRYFAGPRSRFTLFRWPDQGLPKEQFHFVASLTSVERVRDPAGFVDALRWSLKEDGVIVYSVPNQELMPKTASNFPFHLKHFTLHEALTLLDHGDVKMEVFDWGGQNVYEFDGDGAVLGVLPEADLEVRDKTPGQFILVAARRLG